MALLYVALAVDSCVLYQSDRLQNVCVRPQFVQKCVADLKGTNVKVASVIGFPEGTCDLYYKAMYA